MVQSDETLLSIRGLRSYFVTTEGIVRAVDGVDLDIRKGEVVGIVGESGCGKSTLALSILRLLPDPPGKIVGGRVLFGGEDILQMKDYELREIRGGKIAMIFQDPQTTLNPVYTVSNQIGETISIHTDLKDEEVNKKVIEILEKVGISDAPLRASSYPFEFSGGMRQRAMIAMALSCDPNLLIADEPTTNLDVTIQAQILELLIALKEEFNMSILMITHDMGVIAEVSDRIYVMYAGKVMETADALSLFERPIHPYTRGLISSIPSIKKRAQKLTSIPGSVPSLVSPPKGCRFHPRCQFAHESCEKEEPPLVEVEEGHWVSCLHVDKVISSN